MTTRPLPPNLAFRSLVCLALSQACAAQSSPEPTPPAPEATPQTPPASPADAPTPDAATQGPPPGAGPGFKECSSEQWRPGLNATPATPADGVVQRTWAERTNQKMGEIVATEPCTQASNGAACKAALEAVGLGKIRTDSTQMGLFHSDLVWSAGDAVGGIDSREALISWLGPIDSGGDARLVVWADGYRPACDKEPAQTDAGWSVLAVRQVNDCPVTSNSYELTITVDGVLKIDVEHAGTPGSVCIGRLPPGMKDTGQDCHSLGRWLASVAHLEAAAVLAFDQLVDELVHHGAPSELVAAARSAREDEIRHAALFGELARAHGASVPVPKPSNTAVRSLRAIGEDNAREGLVRERYGAVLGLWQARHAATPELRAAFAEVALDELRHAELSIALDAWIRARLEPHARESIDRAQVGAVRELAPTQGVPRALARTLGLPTPRQAQALWSTVV